MTDNEIIKALDCCSKMHVCRECVFWEMHSAQCVSELLSNTLDLINSQKVEIERLKEAYAVYEETTGLKWARAEAIKEFAKRLKKEKIKPEFPWDSFFVTEEAIDNLVKEMTEEGQK
jgi:hypothetical protein